MPSDPVKVLGAMLWYWLGKKTGAYDSVLTFLPPEGTYKKGLLPPSENSGGIGEFGRCWTFFMPRPQIGVLANKNGGGIQTIHCFHSIQVGVFQLQSHAFWAVQHTGHISETDAKLSW